MIAKSDVIMSNNFRNIHIGKLIQQRMEECDIDVERASKFLKISEEEVEQMIEKKSIDSDILLYWSKLLEYDFFRIYTQHLILYAPQDKNKGSRKKVVDNSQLPAFKKNIYTKEIIMYLVELVETGRKSSKQIQEKYNIPKTTILRWIDKYGEK